MSEPYAADERNLLKEVLARLRVVRGPDGRGEHVAWCLFHKDGKGKPPHDPNLHVSERGYHCHACKAKGSLRDLARHLGIDVDGKAKQPVATWDYYSPDGGHKTFQKCRFETPEGKTYALRRAAPEDWQKCPHRAECQKGKRDCWDGWIWTLKEKPCSPGPPAVLYNQPLLGMFPDKPAHLPEGEKGCDVLGRLDLIAVSNPHGAGEWKAEYSEALQGRDVIVLVDADQPGRDHGQLVARSLWGKAKAIKVVDLYPDRDDGSDIADWIAEREARGIDSDSIRAELEALIAQAPERRQDDQTDLPTSPPTKGGVVGGEVSDVTVQEFNFLVLRQKAQGEGFELRFLPFLDEEEIRLICQGFSTLIAAYPKSGKTSLLFPLARQWAVAGRSILYFTEEPEIVWKARVAAAPEEGLERMVGIPGLGVDPQLLLQRAAEGTEEIVIVDTTNLLGIQDGNDSATVQAALSPWVVMARAKEKTPIFAHHTNKSLVGDLKAVAGSYNFAAIVDCVLLLCPDESPTRRVLGGVSRIFAVEPVIYELRDGELRYLGDPKGVALDAVAAKCREVLSVSPGDWMKTSGVLEAMEEPKPGLTWAQRALTMLAERGEILRDPPIEQGGKSGKTYRWSLAGGQTSPPTTPPLVGGEVGGSPQGSLPLPPATGGQ
jgi:hypothetical protein